jgi:hypothetical protein
MVTFGSISHIEGIPPEWTGYGLGAYQFNILGRDLWGGVGIWWGYVALVAYLPEDDISIAVLLNERYFSGNFDNQMRNAHDVLAALLSSIIHWQPTSVTHKVTSRPEDYLLSQNYPNPFNPSTTIDFKLPKSEYVELKVYDVLGREISNLVSMKLNQGNHTYIFDGKNLASGIYYYQLTAGDYRQVKKMILLK